MKIINKEGLRAGRVDGRVCESRASGSGNGLNGRATMGVDCARCNKTYVHLIGIY